MASDSGNTKISLQEHNARLAWIIENTRESVVVTDANGYITWCNQSFLNLTGYQAKEVMGQHPGALLQGPGTDPKTVATMADHLRRQSDFTCEVLNYSKEGNPYWIRLSVQPRFSADGELLEYVAIQNDITEEHRIRTDLEEEVRQRKTLEAQLRHRAQHDELTGLPNRRLFIQKGEEELARVRRYGGKVTVVLADLDHFKTVNDEYGHAVGDHVLCAFSDLCSDLSRELDLVARLGGEEFGLLLPETSQSDAVILADRIRERLAAQPLVATRPDGETVTVAVTVSMGVACSVDPDESIDKLLGSADKAMYRAKNEGRNQVQSYRASDNDKKPVK